jgi:hypothetical protein
MAAHRASWPFALFAGALMILLGISVGNHPDRAPPGWLILIAVLVPLLLGAVKAHHAARNLAPGPGEGRTDGLLDSIAQALSELSDIDVPSARHVGNRGRLSTRTGRVSFGT